MTWDERHFSVLGPLLAFHEPTIAEWLFEDVAPTDDPTESLIAASTVLKRLDAVAAGRKPAPEAPAKLVTALDDMGYGEAERARLGSNLRAALAAEGLDQELEPADEADETDEAEETDEARVDLLVDLKRWHDLAAAVARKAGLKSNQLIRLRLAKRRSPKPSQSTPTE